MDLMSRVSGLSGAVSDASFVFAASISTPAAALGLAQSSPP